MIGQSVADGSGWDTNLGPVLSALADLRPTVVDVGANIGASLLQFEIARPHGSYYCFEPSARFLPVLRANVRANHWTNVQIVDRVLSDTPGSLEIFTNASTASVVSREYDGHPFLFAETVTTSTLDLMLGDLDSLDLVKVDTDGYDFAVLAGGTGLLRRHRPAVYLEFEQTLLRQVGHEPRALLDHLLGLGYVDYFAFSNFGTPLGRATTADEILQLAEPEIYIDLLAVHADRTEQRAAFPGLVDALLAGDGPGRGTRQ